MGNVVKFLPRLAGIDPQSKPIITLRDAQLSLAQSARTLILSLASLDENLRKADALMCQVDDAEVRERARLVSESIHREILTVATRLQNATSLW